MNQSIEEITRERDDALRIIANLQVRCETAEKRAADLEGYATDKARTNDRLNGQIDELNRINKALEKIVSDKEAARKKLSELSGNLLLCLLDNLELLADEFKDDESRTFYDQLLEAIEHNRSTRLKDDPKEAQAAASELHTSWFTFGHGHVHRYGDVTLDRDIVVQITAENPRAIMVDLFGPKWSMEYPSVPDLSKYPRGVFVI